MTNDNKRPSFSIVITIKNDAQLLSENLPAFLHQEYEGDYEVIVVDKSSEDNTSDVLDQLKTQYQQLYTTFLPKYQFQSNRQRLALTIGVKAAKHQWVVFADINTVPSPQWLQELSESTGSYSDLLLGYYQKKSGNILLQTFDEVSKASTVVSITEREHANGHQGKLLRHLRGKYDFMVVRAEKAHDALRLFDCDIKGFNLLTKRIKSTFYNMFH